MYNNCICKYVYVYVYVNNKTHLFTFFIICLYCTIESPTYKQFIYLLFFSYYYYELDRYEVEGITVPVIERALTKMFEILSTLMFDQTTLMFMIWKPEWDIPISFWNEHIAGENIVLNLNQPDTNYKKHIFK